VTLAALEAAVARRAVLAGPEREQTALAVLNGIVGRVELVIGSLNHRPSVADLPAPTGVRLCDGDDFHATPPRSRWKESTPRREAALRPRRATSLGTFSLELAVAVDVDDRSVSPKLGHHPVMLLAEIDAFAAQGTAGLPALLERVWPATSSSLHRHPLPSCLFDRIVHA